MQNEENCKEMLIPAFKQGYSLLLGSTHFFILLKMITTVYERLVKAKSLITQDPINSQFDKFVSIVLLTLGDRRLEQSAYEDYARVLLGKDAYFLFVFDKLIVSTLKNIVSFWQVDEFQASF